MASRRAVLTGFAALAAAGPAAAEKLGDAKKAFPFLDAYLKIPPAERNRFTLSYRITLDGTPPAMWLVDGGRRTPVPLTADGRVARLPTLDQLERSKVAVDAPEKAKLAVNLQIEALAPPASEMDAAQLAAALDQAARGSRKAAGLLRFAMPKLTQVHFRGVTAGEVIYADGRRAALPLDKGHPVFEPAKHPGARMLRFPKAPMTVLIG